MSTFYPPMPSFAWLLCAWVNWALATDALDTETQLAFLVGPADEQPVPLDAVGEPDVMAIFAEMDTTVIARPSDAA